MENWLLLLDWFSAYGWMLYAREEEQKYEETHHCGGSP